MRLENLEKIRKEKGLSRNKLSLLAGINPSVINALEKGYTDAYNVKLSTLLKLASALDVKVRKILPNDLQNKL